MREGPGAPRAGALSLRGGHAAQWTREAISPMAPTLTVQQGPALRGCSRSYALVSEQVRGPRVIDLSNPVPDEDPPVSKLAPGLFKMALPWQLPCQP